MKNKIGFLAFLLCAVVAFSQETYSTWAHYKAITVNTSSNSNGAALTTGLGKFPLLVRLTSANSDVFTQALANGADIRFTKSNGTTRLPHQRERYDAVNSVAEFWVLVDTVNAGDSTQSIRMYWGKTGAADSSNGPQVFAPSNGFLAVWHMGDTTDATGNNHYLTPAANAPGNATVPLIGTAKSFVTASTQAYLVNNATDLNLNTDNGPYTVTAWAAVTTCGNGSTTRAAVISKYDNSNSASVPGRAWALQTSSNSANWRWSNDPLTFFAASATAGNWEYTDDVAGCTAGTEAAPVWTYLAGRNFSAAAPDQTTGTGASRVSIWKDGATSALASALGSVAPNTIGNASSVYIGRLNDGTRYLSGDVDELTISNVFRSADWLKMSNLSQKAAGTSVTLGPTVATASAPGAPTIGTPVAGNTQVVVNWTAPVSDGGSAITGYTVSSTPSSAGCTASSGTTCTVTGLTNGTGYTFTVTATNAIGTSPASSASISVTPAASPQAPSQPTGVTAVAGNGAATVSWTASTANGSAITGYIVTSSPDSKTCTTTGTSCVDSALTNGTAYTFTVVATSVAGNSLPSAATTPAVTPVGTPGAPTIGTVTSGNAQVTVNWTAPTSNGGAAITGYTATSNPGNFTCTASGASTLTCNVTGLTNGTAYTFTVKATNSAGSGAASAASASVTPATVPGAPTSVTAKGGNTVDTVSWVAPTSNGGSAITGYTVSTAADTSKHCSTTTALSCVVTGLTNTTSYSFTVVATNAAGKSASSTASTPATGIVFASKDLAMHITGSSMILNLPEVSGIARVSILDIWGRVVWNKTVSAGVHEVSWGRGTSSGMMPGIYIIRLTVQDLNHKSRLAGESKILITP